MSLRSLEELTARYGLDLTAQEILSEFEAALETVPRGTALTTEEHQFLNQHAGPGLSLDGWDPEAERQERGRVAVASVTRLLTDSMSVKEAADTIGIDRSGLQRRIQSNQIYSFRVAGGRHRVPRWQIQDGHLLPGLDVIVKAIPEQIAPLTVESFMAAPQPELDDQSALTWLASGGNPAAVATLLAGLGIW